MGDFNARVGCVSNSMSEFHGMGYREVVASVDKINKRGESSLSFCALNQLCVANTMSEKKRAQ